MKRPHILLITTDQQRFDALGFNGNREVETPNLDALAAKGYMTIRTSMVSAATADRFIHGHSRTVFTTTTGLPACA